VIWKHAFGNIAVRLITILALAYAGLLEGAVITETVFSWPGIGKLTVDAIFARDYPVVQGAVLLTATLFVLINLATDLIYTLIDPRVRLA
jgi:peptide/nickel transport system permease protein